MISVKNKKILFLILFGIVLLLFSYYTLKDYLINLSFYSTKEYLDILSQQKANQIEQELTVGLKIAQILAYSIEGQHEKMYKFNALYRNSIIGQLQRVLVKYDNIFSLWMNFEPEIFDGIDSKNFIGFSGSDRMGRFMPKLYKENDSIRIECADLIAFNSDKNNIFYYEDMKKYNKEILSNPYYHTFVHNVTRLIYDKHIITLSHPIFYKNEFMGVVGVDFTLDLFENLINTNNLYTFNDMYIILFSNDGSIVASNNPHYKYKKLIDIFCSTHVSNYYNIIMHIIQNNQHITMVNNCLDSNKESYFIFTPIKINDLSQTYTLMYAMPKEKMTYNVLIFMRGLVLIIITISLIILLKKNKEDNVT